MIESQAGPPPGPSVEQVSQCLEELLGPARLRPRLPAADTNLIGVLQQVQDRFGYLPAPALAQIGRRMRIPLSRVYGVVSFYAQFYTEPRGKHTIRCCRGTACHVRGAERVIDTVERTLGIGEGQTTADMRYSLETVACLGTCFLAPVIMIDDHYYGDLTPQRLETILKNHQAEAVE